MAKNLVVVESPGKIRTIGKVLGRDYTVKASIGHVRDLPAKKKDDHAKDSLVVGVAKDFTPTYLVLPKKRKVIESLRSAAESAEKVYLCPDPDREGEAIAWHLAEALTLKPEKFVRVTFDEITPRGIKAGMAHPRGIDMDLVNSQQARRVLDRIVGYTLSPLLTRKIGGGYLTAGRVQSVAVRLLVEREKEIKAFRAEAYWTVEAVFNFGGKGFEASLRALEGKQVVSGAEDLAKLKTGQGQLGASGVVRILIGDAAEANALVEALRPAAYRVSLYEVKEVLDRPYPPFATSQLQQAAANRLGFDAKRTMHVAQQLYEGVPLGAQGPVALITYMRTDSFRISSDALNECRDLIRQRYGENYLPEKPNFYRSRSGAQEAHECIRPTHVELLPEQVKQHLNDEQYKLYKLIHDRFVACQMVPAAFDAIAADIEASGPNTRNAVFRASSRVVKFDGWLAVAGGAAAATVAAHVEAPAADREKGDETDEAPEVGQGPENGTPKAEAKTPAPEGPRPAAAREKPKTKAQVPPMKPGDKPTLEEIHPEEHFTQPPPRYTEASLVKTLEREGIGRPSTYAAILSRIQEVGYATKLGRSGRAPMAATPLGELVTERLKGHFPTIMELSFTREMEAELDKIEEAHLDWRQAVADFYRPFAKELEEARKNMAAAPTQGEKTDTACPQCGSPMEKRLSKFGYYLRCTGVGGQKAEAGGQEPKACGLTMRLDAQGNIVKKAEPQPTGLKCDLCGADVVKSVGRFGVYLHCVNYKPQGKSRKTQGANGTASGANGGAKGPAPQGQACTFTMRLDKQGHPVRKFTPIPAGRECEHCHSPLVVRVSARRSRNTPQGPILKPFLSCSNFPKCRNAMYLPPELASLGEQAIARWRGIDAKNKADLPAYLASQTGTKMPG
ncbi:MAG: type I DNA topoisomerase [Planctomycetota bacterium]|nr:type I DNA topoisomerase [Planctomycetota bacterium]